MDLGATVCTPRRPACGVCPWLRRCEGRRLGIAEALPRKAARAPGPERRGTLWIARRTDGAWLLERRPARGMLGATLGWPGTAWETGGGGEPPMAADWRPAGEVRHGFTHFTVTLEVRAAEVSTDAAPRRGAFVPADAFDPAGLPTLMRKAHRVVREASPRGGDERSVRPGRGRARPRGAPPSSS